MTEGAEDWRSRPRKRPCSSRPRRDLAGSQRRRRRVPRTPEPRRAPWLHAARLLQPDRRDGRLPPLGKDALTRIVDIQPNTCGARLADREMELAVTDEAKESVANEGWDPGLGRRPSSGPSSNGSRTRLRARSSRASSGREIRLRSKRRGRVWCLRRAHHRKHTPTTYFHIAALCFPHERVIIQHTGDRRRAAVLLWEARNEFGRIQPIDRSSLRRIWGACRLYYFVISLNTTEPYRRENSAIENNENLHTNRPVPDAVADPVIRWLPLQNQSPCKLARVHISSAKPESLLDLRSCHPSRPLWLMKCSLLSGIDMLGATCSVFDLADPLCAVVLCKAPDILMQSVQMA